MLYSYNFHNIFAPFETSIYSVSLGGNFRGNFAFYPNKKIIMIIFGLKIKFAPEVLAQDQICP